MRARLCTLRIGIPAPLRHTRSTTTTIAGTIRGAKGGEQYAVESFASAVGVILSSDTLICG